MNSNNLTSPEPSPETKDWAECVFIALGSNVGASRDLFTTVLRKFSELTDGPVLRSSYWKTSPVHCPPGSPEFLNAVVAFKPLSLWTAESLLKRLQSWEREFGRAPKKILNEPRSLDLDIINFRNQIRHDPHLTLPHPRAHQRRFVLEPLVEIAPDLVLPGFDRTIKQLLQELRTPESLTKITA